MTTKLKVKDRFVFKILTLDLTCGLLTNLPIFVRNFAEFYTDAALTHQVILSGISIVASIAALLGAKMYNIYLVGFNILWIIVNYIVAIILNLQVIDDTNAEFEDTKEGYVPYGAPIAAFVIQGIVAILLIYPHAGFIHEVKKGILSPETYPREEFSCCCMDKRR